MNRGKIRGKKLDKDCYDANTTKHQFGPDDNRIFCYGLVEASTEELIDKCKECSANVYYTDLLTIN